LSSLSVSQPAKIFKAILAKIFGKIGKFGGGGKQQNFNDFSQKLHFFQNF
jgi:hypothetical protein